MSGVRIRIEPRGLVLELPRGAELGDSLAAEGVELPCGGRGECGGCRVRVLEGTLAFAEEDLALLGPERVAAGWRLACRCRADGDATIEVEEWRHPILGDETAFAFTPREGVGIAVDVGTHDARGAARGPRQRRRPRRRDGAQRPGPLRLGPHEPHRGGGRGRAARGHHPPAGGRPRLRAARVGTRSAGSASPRVVLVGNTAMHHLFGGLDVAPLAAYPFETTRPDALCWRAGALDWPRAGAAEVVFLPCLGGFVGSDVLAGLRATSLDRAARPGALFDLGTNGEIVVGAGERLYCASAAAGPAFEGARISCGMRAAAGAISAVDAVAGRLVAHVLGGGPARGICGSGLVDVVARGLELGRIEPSGRLAGGANALELRDGLALTQRDIRELQLAKGALAAGLRLLSARAGTEPKHLDRLSLAGAFGNYVSRQSARRIGLFDTPLDRVASAGNAALLGAKLALFDDDLDQRALRARIVHVPLAAEPGFGDAFADAMGFPE